MEKLPSTENKTETELALKRLEQKKQDLINNRPTRYNNKVNEQLKWINNRKKN